MSSPLRRHDRASFFKYVTAPTALAIVQARRLRWSSPLLFNDPFDVPRQASFGFSDDDLLAAISDEFVRVVNGDELPEDAAVRELVLKLREVANPAVTSAVALTLRDDKGPFAPILRKNIAEFRKRWEELLPDVRIVCLAETADSAAMWAHYAQNHSGFVLQFAASDSLDSSLLLAQPVIYRDDPPRLPSLQLWARFASVTARIDWEAVFHEYLYVKTREWSYEREWRVFTISPDSEPSHYSDRPFHPQELEAVLVGAAASEHDVSALKGLLAASDYGHVRVRRARHDTVDRRILFDKL